VRVEKRVTGVGERVAFMRWSSMLKSGISVLLLSQNDPDDFTEIFKNEFLGCGLMMTGAGYSI